MEQDTSNDKTPPWWNALRRVLSGRRRALTERELQEIINESEEEGLINEGEGDMLHSIFEFGDTIVREIMVPRTDMVCSSVEAPLPVILEAIIASGHSRLPVYEGSTDRIVGVVYAKDLLKFWGRPAESVDLSRVMRSPYFVPETKNIEELLQEFRTKRVHMAIAIDEYGGTSGLVTIEDLLEEIVGDIQDEYDLEEEWLVADGGDNFLVDARLSIEELEEHFDVTIPKDKFDTVGGYLFDLFGHVPRPGEVVVEAGLLMEVIESDDRKIHKVRIRPADQPLPEDRED